MYHKNRHIGACEKACYQDSDINHNCLIVKVFVVDSKDTIGSYDKMLH